MIGKILFFSLFVIIKGGYIVPDHRPWTTVLYAQRNITIYVSASNPSREPKQWLFWYDPLIVFNSSKDIIQYNEQVRFQFHIASTEFEDIARKAIMNLMHPDVQRFSLFWIIDPLPIDTLTIYIVDRLFLPVPAIQPCTKAHLHGTAQYECQFQTSSMIIANVMKENILCGKIQFQIEYYIKPRYVPPRIANRFNLMNLRSKFQTNKYIHQRQKEQLLKDYFLAVQTIDSTTKESVLQTLFSLAINTTRHYEITNLNEVWLLGDLERVINHHLFYIDTRYRNQILFHLRNTDSPWLLKSSNRQAFSIEEMQKLFLEQDLLNVEWLAREKRWKINSMIVHQLSDILDTLQLILIDQQYQNDQANATHNRTIGCSLWSTKCSCQSINPGIVFLSNTQFIRIADMNFNFSQTGFTLEFWTRPDALPRKNSPVKLINFRGEFSIEYQPKGEITFSINDSTQSYLYTTTLQSIPLNQWTFISCVYSGLAKQLLLYMNGELASSIILSKSSNPVTNDILIGNGYLGAIRDLRLWSCVRTPDQIRLTMKKTPLLGNETCLVGLWPMADGNGQNILDVSVNGPSHPGTLGFNDNPNLITNPIWLNVVPAPPVPVQVPPKMLTWQIFRQNITLPLVIRWGSFVDIALPADYDGDGFADFAVYRTSIRSWIISSSNNPAALIYKPMGLPGDIPVKANFDGDRFFDFTVFRPSTGQWFSHLSTNPTFQYVHIWGKQGDQPCPGDFDGDGKTDFVVYRKGAYYINPSTDPTVQWTKQWGQPGDLCVPNCDIDGDGVTDFMVWTPKTAIWSWIASNSPWLVYQRQWGYQFDLPTCADFDGDHRSDFVVFRNYTGDWFVMPNVVSSVIITYQWGRPTDLPVGGDYDGNGRSEFGLWRPRANKTYVWEIISSVIPVGLIRRPWGIAGDQVVIGDFDNDKKSDFTVWRPSNGFWYTLLTGRPGIQVMKHWGFTVNDTALAADWDGDGYTDYTIYRPSTGYWYIMLAKNPILQIFMQWGVPRYKDVGVPGDYDGDGKYDFAVWRPSTGMWYILPSSNPSTIVMSQWGIEGDIPVTGVDYDGDAKTDLAVWRPSTGSWYILPSSNPLFPYFGPFLLRQPNIPLPPVVAAPPPPPPPSVVLPSPALLPRPPPPPPPSVAAVAAPKP